MAQFPLFLANFDHFSSLKLNKLLHPAAQGLRANLDWGREFKSNWADNIAPALWHVSRSRSGQSNNQNFTTRIFFWGEGILPKNFPKCSFPSETVLEHPVKEGPLCSSSVTTVPCHTFGASTKLFYFISPPPHLAVIPILLYVPLKES